jgi:hypothetical protein
VDEWTGSWVLLGQLAPLRIQGCVNDASVLSALESFAIFFAQIPYIPDLKDQFGYVFM